MFQIYSPVSIVSSNPYSLPEIRQIGVCRRSATDSSNPIQSRFDRRQKVEGHNVKCLDLTPG
jgi:hypothetical protein